MQGAAGPLALPCARDPAATGLTGAHLEHDGCGHRRRCVEAGASEHAVANWTEPVSDVDGWWCGPAWAGWREVGCASCYVASARALASRCGGAAAVHDVFALGYVWCVCCIPAMRAVHSSCVLTCVQRIAGMRALHGMRTVHSPMRLLHGCMSTRTCARACGHPWPRRGRMRG